MVRLNRRRTMCGVGGGLAVASGRSQVIQKLCTKIPETQQAAEGERASGSGKQSERIQ